MACAPPYFLQTGTITLQTDGFYTVACSWLHPDPLPDYFTIWIYDATLQQWIVQAAFQEVTGAPGTTRLAALVGLPPGRIIRWWVQSICFGGAEASPFVEGPTVQTPGECFPPGMPAAVGSPLTVQGDGFLTRVVQFQIPNPAPDHFLLSIFDQTHGTTVVSGYPLYYPGVVPGSTAEFSMVGLPPNSFIRWFLASICPPSGTAEREGPSFTTPGPVSELALLSLVQQADGFYTQNVQWRVPSLAPSGLIYNIWTQNGPVVENLLIGGPFNAGQIMPAQLVGLPPASQVSWQIRSYYPPSGAGGNPATIPVDGLFSDGPGFSTPSAVGIVKHRGESFNANLAFNYQGRQATLNLSMIAVHHGSGNVPGTTVFLDVPNTVSPQPFQRALSIAISNELPVGIYDALVRISEVGGSILYETTFPNTWEVV